MWFIVPSVPTRIFGSAVVVCLALSACGLIVGADPLTNTDSVQGDLAEYDALVTELEQRRTLELQDEADWIGTAGDWLLWLEPGPTAPLHARGVPDGVEVVGPVAIGDGQTPENFRASSTHAMTARLLGASVRYEAWRLVDGQLIDQRELPTPEGALWSPYALLDDRAFVISDDPGSHSVLGWQLGAEPPSSIGTLEQAGISVGVLVDFGVLSDGRLIVLESGRLWLLDDVAWSASWIETDTEVGSRIAFDDEHLLFTTADGGLHLVDLADASRRRIDEELEASGWELNPTYASIHLFSGEGATLLGDRVIYLGSAGVFGFAIDAPLEDAIQPILLEPRWDPQGEAPRIEYVDLWPIAESHVIVTGLESASGSVGADGPVYSVAID